MVGIRANDRHEPALVLGLLDLDPVMIEDRTEVLVSTTVSGDFSPGRFRDSNAQRICLFQRQGQGGAMEGTGGCRASVCSSCGSAGFDLRTSLWNA